ncbi:type II/III secretion system protein [Legionella erythra]|uniref:Type II/III secretion system protein n=1 Tax=Legionella erythra TaxID=448 RepID=A0A0W0TTX5_LEGER|nr:type II/III secretion system protein [Legionella erythra]KTC99122.1 type II/III secretion system protein [Legionella erythra]
MKKWYLLLSLVVASVFAEPRITKVIDLHYQDAAQVIQLIQPLLKEGDKVTGSGQTLIVNVSPDTLTALRAVLHKLDTPPVVFEITIFQGDSDWLSTQDGHTETISTPSQINQRRRQSITVMNGESAFVSTGESQPVIRSVGLGLWTGVSFDRRLVQNGLLIEPILQGNQVKIIIKRVREQTSNMSNQVFHEQKVETTMLIPLDHWVALASAQGSAPAEPGTEVIRAGTPFAQNSTLYIKVNIRKGKN